MLNRLFIRCPVNVFVFTFPRGEAHIKTVLGQLHPSKISLNPETNANPNQVGEDEFFFGAIIRIPNLTSQKEKSKSHIIKIISQK